MGNTRYNDALNRWQGFKDGVNYKYDIEISDDYITNIPHTEWGGQLIDCTRLNLMCNYLRIGEFKL